LSKKPSINIYPKEGETNHEALVRMEMSSTFKTAANMNWLHTSISDQPYDISAGMMALKDRIDQINSGDLSCTIESLSNQAAFMEAVYIKMYALAMNAEDMTIRDQYFRAAENAQKQAAQTLKIILNHKEPNKTQFIKQQTNVANGPQQVQNIVELKPNKLLKDQNETLDIGRTGAPERIGAKLETVGKINRTKNA
jgi:hypothetical protein